MLAYSAALPAVGVDVREHCAFTGLRTAGGRVVGVDTSAGPIATDRVVLTGGPQLADVGTRAGGRVPAGGTRHQVVVTAALPGLNVYELPMVFDVASGIYWRPGESGGLLWGMSNPDEPPGVAVDFDVTYYRKARDRIEELFPAVRGLGLRRSWAATIDYTPDHLPILGPLLTDDGPVDGTVVASAAGHGMMWGPGHRPGRRRPDHDGCLHLAGPDRSRARSIRRRRQQSRCPRTHFAPVPGARHRREDHLVTQAIITSILPLAADADLEDWGPLPEATGDEMATHGLELWADGDMSAGIWQCARRAVTVDAGDQRGHLPRRRAG